MSGFDLKIIALGCGNIGSIAAGDLAQSLPSAKIVVADVDQARAQQTAAKIGRDNVESMAVDASNYRELVRTMKEFDLAVGALPGFMGFRACKASISAGVDMVDVSFMPEDVMMLYKDALKANVCVVPDCGMSPGLGSILVGHAVSQMDQVESVHLLNGGLPEKPLPPLDYVITWSSKDLIELYTRRANIVRNGKTIQVEATTGLEEITFPHVGRLQGFHTDGLRTLLHTVKGTKEMWEKSLRYPGHIEKMNLLKALGFLEERPVKVDSVSVSPRSLTEKLLEIKLKRPGTPDFVAMLVEVAGLKDGRKVRFTYQMLDRFDKRRKVTAMARTTAYTASVVAQLVAKKTLDEKGVIPPERLGMNGKLYTKYINMMRQRGIIVKESKKRIN